jgi:hypothetical protein
MGYSTDFYGSLKLSRPATEAEVKYINDFSETRRMKRDVNKLMEKYNGDFGILYPKNKETPEAIYGVEGAYFNNPDDDDTGVIDHNIAPGQTDFLGNNENGQPGLWCNWVISIGGEELEWNGAEKFYSYIEWLEYLIKHFFEPWGIKLNGEIEWVGEDSTDRGKIVVYNNIVKTLLGKITYHDK